MAFAKARDTLKCWLEDEKAASAKDASCLDFTRLIVVAVLAGAEMMIAPIFQRCC
jgi:hypothetical protein